MKKYNDINVYEETQNRLKFIFNEFDFIYVSFSGGKDSGLLLNLVIDFIKKNKINKKIGLLHMDMECRFTETSKYIERTYNAFKDYIIPYWLCNEVKYENSFSSDVLYWYPWDLEFKNKWCRELPNYDFIITDDKNRLPYMVRKMEYKQSINGFAKYCCDLHNTDKVAHLVGLRADESLHRYKATTQNEGFKNIKWSTKNKNGYSFYPIYDWRTEDLWLANYKFNYDYNYLYDLFHIAGISLKEQRVAQPFSLAGKKHFDLYKSIDYELWNKFLIRIQGINSNSLGYLAKPTQYNTYEEYFNFLINTLSNKSKTIFDKKILGKKNSFDDLEEYYKLACRTILNIGIEGDYFKQLKINKTNKITTASKWSNIDE